MFCLALTSAKLNVARALNNGYKPYNPIIASACIFLAPAIEEIETQNFIAEKLRGENPHKTLGIP